MIQHQHLDGPYLRIPLCRLCSGSTPAAPEQIPPCSRCRGSQLDQAWKLDVRPSGIDGFASVALAFGAHGSTAPGVPVVVPDAVVDLLTRWLPDTAGLGIVIIDRR